ATFLRPPRATLFPYTTLFRSERVVTRWQPRNPATPPEPMKLPRWLDGVAAVVAWIAEFGLWLLLAALLLVLALTARYWLPWLRRSEEHTSELQSRENLVCRLL